jgi:exodeoxyribonuclease-3
VKIVTFNINNLNKRLKNLVAWVVKTNPDVVCLQELKAEQRAFPAHTLRAVGYRAVWQGEVPGRAWRSSRETAIRC